MLYILQQSVRYSYLRAVQYYPLNRKKQFAAAISTLMIASTPPSEAVVDSFQGDGFPYSPGVVVYIEQLACTKPLIGEFTAQAQVADRKNSIGVIFLIILSPLLVIVLRTDDTSVNAILG